jgi:hypothetical protein
VKTDIDGLLARATADCADPTDLMEFTSSLIAYLKRLEVAAREVVDDSDSRVESLLAGLNRATCWCCDRWVDIDPHRDDCALARLAALLEDR